MNKQLRRDAVRGIGWAFLNSISGRALQTITTLMLAKLLVPADFGVFALASIFINGLGVLPDVGFPQVLIYLQGDIRKSANTAFILSTATGILFALLIFLFADTIGMIFSTPDIVWPIRAMAPTLIISSATSVPAVLLDRDLKFKKKAMSEIPGAIAYTIVSIILAAVGMGVWSLVIGWAVMVIVDCVITWLVCSWRPTFELGIQEAKVIIDYGKHLVVSVFAAFIFLQVDKAAVGKWLGMSVLGAYSIAFTVCNLPATNLTSVLNQVMFPTYSKLGNIPEIRAMYLNMVRQLSFIVFPLSSGLMIMSGPLIQALYGNKWAHAVPLFGILAVYGLIRAISTTTDAVFKSTDNPALMRKMNLIQLLVSGVFIYPAVQYFDAVGVAVLITVASLAGALFGMAKVQRLLDIKTSAWAESMWMPLIASAVSGGIASLMLRRPSWSMIILSTLVFVLTYGCATFLMNRSIYVELTGLIKNLGQGRMASGESAD